MREKTPHAAREEARGPILGIDPDTRRIAFAFVNRAGRVRAVRTVERADSRGRVRADYDAALAGLFERAAQHGATVYAEGIFLRDRRRGSVVGFRSLAEVQGEMKAAARRAGVRLETVAVSTWRAPVLGFTRDRARLKAAAMKRACQHWAGALTEHEADAVCIALYGATAAARAGAA